MYPASTKCLLLAEIEKILEEVWITEENRFRSILNGLDKATV